MHKFKIAIIGAGWLGIGCLRVLSQKGYEVDVFEKNNDLGGVWHPDNNYAGLRIHAPSSGVAFPDFPLPGNIDRLERITSAQIFAYLKDYCTHFDIYKYMCFNVHVTSIRYDSTTKKTSLTIRDQNNHELIRDGYDYIIYTHGLTDRTIPSFKDKELFLGKIYHSFDVNEKLLEEMILANKRITVLGGSKTATDFILKFNERGYNVNWLCRTPYWFTRFETARKWLEKKHRYYGTKFIWLFGGFYGRYMPKTILWLWIKCNIIHTFGKPHLDHRKFHLGIIDDAQMAILKRYYQQNATLGEVSSLKENGIFLKDGKNIPTDILICCTGSAPSVLIDVYVDETKISLGKITSVYRGKVIPEVPNLIFTSFVPFSANVIRGISEGNWIAKYFELQPDTEYLMQNATHYDYNFFSLNPLFDSTHSLAFQLIYFYDPFIKSKELTRKQLASYVYDNFFNADSNKPLEFKLPNSDQKVSRCSLIKKFTSLFKKR